MWLSVNAINDVLGGVRDGTTDHVVIVINKPLVNDVSIMFLH